MQTRSVTWGDFYCKRQLETPLRCKLQEKIASCDSAFSTAKTIMSVLKSILNTDSSRLSVSSRRPEDMKNARCTQNEVVVDVTEN